MREILFRGRRKNGEWVKGYYVESKYHWHKRGVHEAWIVTKAHSNGGYFAVTQRYAVDKSTVCEYTGLKDNDGNPIFENDIIEDVYGEDRWIVKFFDCRFWGVDAKNEYSDEYLEDLCDRDGGFKGVKIVGNIYDNQELIGGTP